MKRRLSILVLCIIICSVCIPTVQAAVLYDLQGHWAADDVSKLMARGSVGGYPDGSFKPDASITRAEFSKILRQSLGLTSVTGNDFADTAEHWAVSDIHTLADSQIIVPVEYGRNYGPDYNITRREIAIMLIRAMGLNDSATAYSGQTTGFTDDASIKSYDKGYLYLAKELGLVGGYEDGTFRPNNRATRAEACVMIVRLLTLMGIDTDSPAQMNPETPSLTPESGSTDVTASQQNSYQIIVKEIRHSVYNTLREQYVQATLQLTVPNGTAHAITVTESDLDVIVTYSTDAQVVANQSAFSQTISAGQSKTLDTVVNILLPNNQVANIVLGNSITNIQVQLTVNGQTYDFEDINTTLLNAVQ